MSDKSCVLCFIGSGAVKGAWDPVLEALKDAGATSPDTANCLMARAVFMARWSYTRHMRRLTSDDDIRKRAKQKRLLRKGVKDVGNAIAERLREAEERGQLEVQRKFGEVMKRFVLEGGDGAFGFVTTNWDGSTARAIKEVHARLPPPLHLHGTSHARSTLYLPSEVADERYRTKAQRDELHKWHGIVMDTLDSCTKLVIYGLGLDPLDAELGQLLASGLTGSTKLREVVIVDPSHERAAARLRTMLPRVDGSQVQLIGYRPNGDWRASAGVDYQVP